MIALILGGAPSVFDEAEAAQAMLGQRPHLIVAANLAGIHWGGRLDAWASLHSNELPGWIAQRRGNADFRTFVANVGSGVKGAEYLPERWPGSSGLYAAQAALGPMVAAGAILCGVPMDTQAGHFAHPGPWARTTTYRNAFLMARKAVGHRIRSMGGWTKEQFGAPCAAWLDGRLSEPPRPKPPPAPRTPMHKVTNETETTQKLRVNHPAGGFTTAYLKPGESGHFDIDPRQSAVSRGLLKATEVRERAEKPAKAKALSKKAAPKPPRRKTAPAAHAEVAEAPLIAGRSLSDTDSDANG